MDEIISEEVQKYHKAELKRLRRIAAFKKEIGLGINSPEDENE